MIDECAQKHEPVMPARITGVVSSKEKIKKEIEKGLFQCQFNHSCKHDNKNI